jgi:cytosine/adenosine deaminase-related metal-dependent hydrolase
LKAEQPLVLLRARLGAGPELADLRIDGARVTRVAASGALAASGRTLDLAGRLLLPALVNAHDHLDLATLPPLGRPPYANAALFLRGVEASATDPAVRAGLAPPLSERLFLGALRNLLAGVSATVHHGPYHRSLARPELPVRVLGRYQFASSPRPTPALLRSYRSTDRRIPWFVHAGEGSDALARGEVEALAAANLVRHNSVIVHGIALGPGDVRRLAEAQACVVWCPEAERRLYGACPDVTALRAAGVRVGLGSESAACGARDALSNLAAARREGLLEDAELLELASRGSAEVARLPCGGLGPGDAADLVAVSSREGFLSGDRRAIALSLVAGQPRFGEPDLVSAALPNARRLRLGGEPRALEARTHARLASLLRSHPGLGKLPWLADVELS